MVRLTWRGRIEDQIDRLFRLKCVGCTEEGQCQPLVQCMVHVTQIEYKYGDLESAGKCKKAQINFVPAEHQVYNGKLEQFSPSIGTRHKVLS